jgi:hypothetical protein
LRLAISLSADAPAWATMATLSSKRMTNRLYDFLTEPGKMVSTTGFYAKKTVSEYLLSANETHYSDKGFFKRKMNEKMSNVFLI